MFIMTTKEVEISTLGYDKRENKTKCRKSPKRVLYPGKWNNMTRKYSDAKIASTKQYKLKRLLNNN